jgi:hypothetical protein
MKYLFVKLRNIYDYRVKWVTDLKKCTIMDSQDFFLA